MDLGILFLASVFVVFGEVLISDISVGVFSYRRRFAARTVYRVSLHNIPTIALVSIERGR